MQQQRIAAAISAARTHVVAMRSMHATRSERSFDAEKRLLKRLANALDELSAAAEALREEGSHSAAARGTLEIGFHRYQELFEFMPDGYLVTDEAGIIREANKAALSLLGKERTEAIGRPIAGFAAPQDRVRLRRQLAITKRDAGSHNEVEVTLLRRDRAPLPAVLTIASVREHEDHPAGFRLLLRDLSERRKIEQAAQAASAVQAANEAKDEFLAMLSHELRNPLNAILGWSGIMREETLPRDQLAMALETIDRNGHQLNRLVSDLLDVARIAQRKLLFELKACDLGAVVAGAFDSVQHELVRRGQHFSAKLNDPGTVIADPNRLQQIVSNLLGNAVKFTPAGGAIDLKLDADGRDIEIVVRDTGIGIDPDLLPHVFDRFRQGDAAPTERGGGLGLGLPIARTLARMHGGDLWADSPGPNHGSTFTLRLPLHRQVEAIGDRDPSQPVEPESPLQHLIGLNVLVVCLDQRVAEELAHSLTLTGATASTSSMPVDTSARPRGWKADAMVVVVPRSLGVRFLADTTVLEKQFNGTLPVLAITPSSASARRWLSFPAEVALCTRGEVDATRLRSRLGVLARISGWKSPC